jgi:predicted CopG family antitoxin
VKGTIIEITKEVNNKFSKIKDENKSFDIRFPTKILL